MSNLHNFSINIFKAYLPMKIGKIIKQLFSVSQNLRWREVSVCFT
uniref:Uncharacterized protein n=1 Tax=Lotus japonicus TaxID=34305 RepID=I3SP49_LOTJA|nr:unknown [Lotus japonicus]